MSEPTRNVYIIVSGSNREELVTKVNEMLAHGYHPVGNHSHVIDRQLRIGSDFRTGIGAVPISTTSSTVTWSQTMISNGAGAHQW